MKANYLIRGFPEIFEFLSLKLQRRLFLSNAPKFRPLEHSLFIYFKNFIDSCRVFFLVLRKIGVVFECLLTNFAKVDSFFIVNQ